MSRDSEPSCSCCGTYRSVYQESGHDRECVWYEEEMYRLAEEWRASDEEADWKRRFDLVVGFLLEQTRCLKEERS